MIRRPSLRAAALVVSLTLPGLAQDGFGPEQEWGPSPVPDRIVLTWSGDPATTQAVTWRTVEAVETGMCQWAVATDGPEFAKDLKPSEGTSEVLASNLGRARYHTVELTGLEPDTLYAYRVGSGDHFSEVSHFRTASAAPGPFTFVYFGDAQNALKPLWSRVVRESILHAPEARFTLHAGDLINIANSDAEWGEWFYAGGWLNRRIPALCVTGNHEYYSMIDGRPVKRLSEHWRPTFAFPMNGPKGHEELVYHLDYQGVRFVALDTNVSLERQIPWLRKVLAENPHPWTILTFHHPVYSASKGRDNPILRQVLQPVLDEFRVDLVLQGHDHSYMRSPLKSAAENLPEGVAKRDPKAGTVYVVSISGPKMYELKPDQGMARSAQNTQLFQVITVDGGELRYDAYTVTGTRYDGFTLRKREDAPNELLDRTPETPERR